MPSSGLLNATVPAYLADTAALAIEEFLPRAKLLLTRRIQIERTAADRLATLAALIKHAHQPTPLRWVRNNTSNMTAIAIWLKSEDLSNPSWWVAGDSRVTTSVGNADDSVKVFSLPVICRSADPEGYFSKVAYVHSFGYCFAGSTVMGQNSYLALAPLLGNLIVSSGYRPSLEHVAQYVYKYLQSTYDSFKLVAGKTANFNVALFGYCHHVRRLRLYHITPVRMPHQGTVLAMNEVLGPFLYLGDAQDKVIDRLNQAIREQASSAGLIGMAPAHVIQECINDDSMPTIGGAIQFGVANADGYHHLSTYKPRVLGKPESIICYMGKELDADLSFVGEAKISHPAIPWPWG